MNIRIAKKEDYKVIEKAFYSEGITSFLATTLTSDLESMIRVCETVKEAKGEVEAFTQNKMHSLALDALKKDNEWIGNLDAQNKLLDEGE